ncbi:hypothetical protein F2P79_011754 [Pimephales promelas]|nr:hypothetical protein F2P79_011754 [Pimephales promelas]
MVCTRILFASIVSALIVSEVEMRNDDSNVIISVANFAMNFHNRMSSYPYAFKVVDIISDTTQLYPPARVKYILQIQAGQTVCENQASVNLTHCALQSNPESRPPHSSPSRHRYQRESSPSPDRDQRESSPSRVQDQRRSSPSRDRDQ